MSGKLTPGEGSALGGTRRAAWGGIPMGMEEMKDKGIGVVHKK